MPLYEARSLDVLGNPVDGYEVNESHVMGDVYIPPHPETQTGLFDAFNRAVSDALVDRGWLAQPNNRGQGEYEIEGPEAGLLTVLGPEAAWAGAVDGPRRDRFIDMIRLDDRASTRARTNATTQLQSGEQLVRVDGMRPLVDLEPQQLADDGPADAEVEFWNTVIEYKHDKKKYRAVGPCGSCSPPGILVEVEEGDTGNVVTQRCDECRIYDDDQSAEQALHKIRGYALTIELGYYADTERIGVEIRAGDVDRGEGNTSDRFEWPLADWQRNPTFGFDPVTSEPLAPTKEQVDEILVALDHFMETGKQWRR